MPGKPPTAYAREERGGAQGWLKEHSLSLVITGIWLALTAWGYWIEDQVHQSYIHGLAHDAFGGLIIVVATKYFIERGSPQSK